MAHRDPPVEGRSLHGFAFRSGSFSVVTCYRQTDTQARDAVPRAHLSAVQDPAPNLPFLVGIHAVPVDRIIDIAGRARPEMAT
jgi:hypothetical protein